MSLTQTKVTKKLSDVLVHALVYARDNAYTQKQRAELRAEILRNVHRILEEYQELYEVKA